MKDILARLETAKEFSAHIHDVEAVELFTDAIREITQLRAAAEAAKPSGARRTAEDTGERDGGGVDPPEDPTPPPPPPPTQAED